MTEVTKCPRTVYLLSNMLEYDRLLDSQHNPQTHVYNFLISYSTSGMHVLGNVKHMILQYMY